MWRIDWENFARPLVNFNIMNLIKEEKNNFLNSWKYDGNTIYFLNKETFMELNVKSGSFFH